jgi:hypothetical protein
MEKTAIQTIAFDKAIFTKDDAREWCKSHGYKSDIIEVTDQYIRVMQMEEFQLMKPFRMKKIRHGVNIVLGRKKNASH